MSMGMGIRRRRALTTTTTGMDTVSEEREPRKELSGAREQASRGNKHHMGTLCVF